MRRIACLLLLLLLGLGIGISPFTETKAEQPPQNGRRPAAQPGNGNAVAANAPANNASPLMSLNDPVAAEKMERLLKLWEQRSATVKTIDAHFTRFDDIKVDFQSKDYYVGRAILQSPNLAILDFQKTDEKFKNPIPHERIIATGKEVWQYVHKVKEIVIYPIPEDQRQQTLQQGPLPFLFNMKADEAKKRYTMYLRREDDQFYFIQIIPKTKEEKENFSQAIVKLKKANFLPERLQLVDAMNGKDVKEFIFSRIDSNPTLRPELFAGTLVKDWKVIRDPTPGGARRAGSEGGLAPANDNPQAAPRRPSPAPGTAPVRRQP